MVHIFLKETVSVPQQQAPLPFLYTFLEHYGWKRMTTFWVPAFTMQEGNPKTQHLSAHLLQEGGKHPPLPPLPLLPMKKTVKASSIRT